MKHLFILLFCLFPFCIQGSSERYNFSCLSLEDGLSQITVTAIHQDYKGYLWFGTRSGLNRYNGYTFEVFSSFSDDPFSISDNHILCITEDQKGNLWIGTNNGLNRLELSTQTFFRYLQGSMIHSLCFDEDEKLWVGSNNGLKKYDTEEDTILPVQLSREIDSNPVFSIIRHENELILGTAISGVIHYNLLQQTFLQYTKNSDSPLPLPDNDIRILYMDKRENLWIGTHHNGVLMVKGANRQVSVYNLQNGLTNNYIRCITETPEGDILIGTFNGLNRINIQTGEITSYHTYDSQHGHLSHYSIYSIFFDRSQTLWVGTYAGGINYHNPYGQKFRFFDPGSELRSITGIIGPMVKKDHFLYIATEGGGLLEMNTETETFRLYPLTDRGEGGYAHNIIKSLYLDEDRILCGTNVGTIYSFHIPSRKFSSFHDFKQGNAIYHISKNRKDEWVIGGVNQLGFRIIEQGGTTVNAFPLNDQSVFSFHDIRCIYEKGEDVYLIGTRNNGLYVYDRIRQEIKHYKKGETDRENRLLPENYITSILEDTMGRIWIGTGGGGFARFDMEAETFHTYDAKDGLYDNTVCMLIEDDNRQLWISTLSGISLFNPQNERFTNYSHSAGIKVHEFSPHAGLKGPEQMILFSGNNGFLSFNPRKMAVNPFIPPVRLENLYIHNERIIPSPGGRILTTGPDEQKQIVLKHNESNFTIEYNALNYIFPDQNRYTYILEGFDKQWNEVGNRRTAYYTNVPPGKYRFLVRGSNNDALWNLEGTTLSIHILPPLWKTWWAYLLYTLTTFTIIGIILRHYNEKKRLENEFKLKQAEARAQDEFHQERNKLFTNFSHELRTPLTLILSPLEELVQKGEELPARIRQSHRLMYNNCLRMLRLVNNLMDFQKKESGKIQLKVTENDFAAFSAEMFSLFTDLAESRSIQFRLQITEESIPGWFDKSLMEKVFFNFLSNAFKNVPDEGAIQVTVTQTSGEDLAEKVPAGKLNSLTNTAGSYIWIDITDSGTGIPENELEKIFTPFYQVAQNEHAVSGTGLGLSLSKAIIEMHHGIVWAESGSGKGATFRCILPVCKEIFRAEELLDKYTYEKQTALRVEIQDTSVTESNRKKKRHTLLIVEDNAEVRKYIIRQLSDDYQIIEAINGAEGLDKAIIQLPDLVISDLMMPKMDGMEFTNHLKTDLRTSHIPVILLTARTMPEDMKEGLETGADDYITKPFSPALLKVRVNNLIQSREKLKEIYGKQFTLETIGVERTSADDRFMQKLYQSMEKNIANPDLNLDSFSKEIGMSRANLYRKIKTVTGMSPTEFVRNFRLEMSARILKEARLPVSEVFVAVGFNSHVYFSSCFKALYGITPTEYARLGESGKQE